MEIMDIINWRGINVYVIFYKCFVLSVDLTGIFVVQLNVVFFLLSINLSIILYEILEDIKGVIRSRDLRDRQYNVQMKKKKDRKKSNSQQSTIQKTIVCTTWTPYKLEVNSSDPEGLAIHVPLATLHYKRKRVFHILVFDT